MIIDLTKTDYEPGYLPRSDDGLFHPFFPTANAAFRVSALRKAGGFDAKCDTGEDIDLCIRVARAGYELWYAPEAVMHHHDRHTLSGMWRQWFEYGYGHPYLYRKHLAQPRLRIYRFDLDQWRKSPLTLRRVVDLPFPFYGMIYVGSFLIGHVALAAALACWFAAAPLWSVYVLLAVCGAVAVSYLKVRFDIRRPLRSLQLAAVRYGVHWAYVAGGFLGGLRQGALFIETTCSRPNLPLP